METEVLIDNCKHQGAVLMVDGLQLRVKGWSRLAPELQQSLREQKPQLIEYLRDRFEPFVLREWRRTSIPDWRFILQESIEKKVVKREEYARWMLRDILLDPDYEGPGS